MKNTPQEKIEQELISELRRIEAPYRRALSAIAASAPDPEPTTEQVQACLIRLQPQMAQIQEMETALAPLRSRWMTMQRRPGLELSRILEEHELLLGSLISKIDALERHLAVLRQRMLPELDRHVRHQQMQRAYVRGG